MKIKNAVFLLLAAAALLLASCDILFSLNDNKKTDDSLNNNLPEGKFYAQNLSTKKFYIVDAEKLYETDRCEIWAEKNSRVTENKAKEIANKYDNTIYNLIIDNFSMKDFYYTYEGQTEHFDNMMEFADWLTDGNGKLTILLLDIKDGYTNDNQAYTAGYFFGGDFYTKGAIKDSQGNIYYSNGKTIMYIDTNPGVPDSEDSYSTFAHELQHLVNYCTSIALDRTRLMDTWIDEGLSTQAEFLYLGKHSKRVGWFNDDKAGTIARGNNFFVWGNHRDVSDSTLDDYATVYLFFHWLYLQNNKSSKIFLDITTGAYTDFQTVTSAASKIDTKWSDWNTLLSTWMAANYAPTTTYGYKGDADLEKITVKTISTLDRKITLYPGEGVYSRVNSSNNSVTAAGSGAHIKYAGLSKTAAPVSITSGIVSGTAMLTYNVDTANDINSAITETGYLTGAPSGTSASVSSDARSLADSGYDGPQLIDARDILGRDRALPIIPFRRQ